MKILVCYKWIKDADSFVVDEENKTLNMDRAKYHISEMDLNALELAVTLQEEHENVEIVVLSVGENVSSSTKDVLARGADKAFYVETTASDSYVSSKTLAEAIKKIGNIDLILCGEGSGDGFSQQVGPRLAAMLGYELVTYVSKFDMNGNEMVAHRKLDDGVEVVKVETPAVITVLSEINQPRVPGMRQILSAKKKPAEAIQFSDLGLDEEQLKTPIKVINVGPSIQNRKQIRINDDGEDVQETVKKLVDILKDEKAI